MPRRRPTDWMVCKLRRHHTRRERRLVEQVHFVQGGRWYDMFMTPVLSGGILDTDTGVMLDSRQQQWIVSKTEFTRHGLSRPARGNRIIRHVGDERIEYDLVSPDGSPVYVNQSRHRLTWRLFSQELRTQPCITVRPCFAEARLSTDIGAVSIGWQTSPAVATLSTVDPTVVIS